MSDERRTTKIKNLRGILGLKLVPIDSVDSSHVDTLDEVIKNFKRSAIFKPIVICSQKDAPGHYVLIDGRARLELARDRGGKRLQTIVLPPLTVEQQVLLRGILNADQHRTPLRLLLQDLQEARLLSRKREQ